MFLFALGQLSLAQEMKPADAKAKAKAKAKHAIAKASVAAKAKSGAAPAVEADAQPKFGMRKHKRKTKDGHVCAFAIFNNTQNKQVAQLTDLVAKDAESIITQRLQI